MKTRIVQKAVVVNDDNKILILRRSKTDTRRPLQWDPPGGLCEESEQLKDSINREVLEETGLRVTRLKLSYAITDVRIWIDEKKLGHTENVIFMYYTAHSEPG